MAKLDRSPTSLLELWLVSHSADLSATDRSRQELLINLYNAIADRLDPPPEEEAALWSKGIRVIDHADGTSSTVPCWTSRLEYEAWHRVRFPGTFVSLKSGTKR
jgi:hypothetical protein